MLESLFFPVHNIITCLLVGMWYAFECVRHI